MHVWHWLLLLGLTTWQNWIVIAVWPTHAPLTRLKLGKHWMQDPARTSAAAQLFGKTLQIPFTFI